MPRLILDGASLPVTVPGPTRPNRWFVTGYQIQGTGDGLVTVSGGNRSGAANETLFSVRTAAGGGGAVAAQGAVDIGTALTGAELIVATTGTPGTVTGYIDYSWR